MPEVQVRPQGTSAPLPASALRASVVTKKKPAAFALDGDVAEWGSLLPAAQATIPPDNHLAIAIDSYGVTIAGQLTAAAAASGIWIALRLDVPEVPPIGTFVDGGARFEAITCDDDAHSGAFGDECRRRMAEHEKFEGIYSAMFQQIYRLDRQGLHVAREGGSIPAAAGALPMINGARVQWKDSPQGVTVEASFPQKVLPHTLQAPLVKLDAVVRVADADKPPSPRPEEWQSLVLPEPVGFEPYAKLREAAFGAAKAFSGPQFVLMYQPGADLDMQSLEYEDGGMAVGTISRVLFRKETTLGDLEVGYVYNGFTALAALRNGAPTDVETLFGDVMGQEMRGNELHYYLFEHAEGGDDVPVANAEWHVFAVQPDGQIRTDVLAVDAFEWSSATEFHEPDFKSFGVLGYRKQEQVTDPLIARTLTWTYDDKKNTYVQKEGTDLEKALPASLKNGSKSKADKKSKPDSKPKVDKSSRPDNTQNPDTKSNTAPKKK